MTLRIRCGGEEKIFADIPLLSLKFDVTGGVNIIGPCTGEVVKEFDLGGAHFTLYEDELCGELQDQLADYTGSLLLDAKIDGVEILYTK